MRLTVLAVVSLVAVQPLACLLPPTGDAPDCHRAGGHLEDKGGCSNEGVCVRVATPATVDDAPETDAGAPKRALPGACADHATCESVDPAARCLDGTCAPVAAQCTGPGQCREGQVCWNGACEMADDAATTPAACVTVLDCPVAYRCAAGASVVEQRRAGSEGEACGSDHGCAAGLVCDGLYCVRSSPGTAGPGPGDSG